MITHPTVLTEILEMWLHGMKANGDKYHFLLSTKEKVKANISMNNDKEKLLRGTIDNHLIFESQIKNLCCKASQKLYAISRVSYIRALISAEW